VKMEQQNNHNNKEEESTSFVEDAVYAVSAAVEADNKGEYEKALNTYRDALNRFNICLKHEKERKQKDVILERMEGYKKRAQELREYLWKQKNHQNHEEADGTNMISSTPWSEVQLKNEKKAKTTPDTKHSPCGGITIVSSSITSLDSQTSFFSKVPTRKRFVETGVSPCLPTSANSSASFCHSSSVSKRLRANPLVSASTTAYSDTQPMLTFANAGDYSGSSSEKVRSGSLPGVTSSGSSLNLQPSPKATQILLEQATPDLDENTKKRMRSLTFPSRLSRRH